MTPDELRAAVAGIQWFHSIDLGHGIVTPGASANPDWQLSYVRLPESLAGRTVLDVGAWDGFWSFECERRGARRVVALDHPCWNGGDWGTKAGFELARRALGSRVEDLDMDLFELSPERVGRFDVVLLLGVLYHLRNPLVGLERVASVTGDLLILETAADLLGLRRPALAFYPGAELDNDPTNWFGPNVAALKAMLRTVGFTRCDVVWVDSVLRRFVRGLKALRAGRRVSPAVLRRGRVVIHARR